MITRRHALHLAASLAATGGLASSALSPEVRATCHVDSALPGAIDPETVTDALGDYELTINIDFDFQDYSTRLTGDKTRMTYGQYVIGAGRENGAWRMYVQRVLADDPESGEHVVAPVLFDVEGQTDGLDPLALLQRLLGGQAVLDGTKVIRGLSLFEHRALAAASPETKAELIGLMQRHGRDKADSFANWFGRWALSASARELDGFWHSDPAYTELAARVKRENLLGKALAQEAADALGRAQALAREADRMLGDGAA